MADRSFLDRVWPSLVALVGTVTVVVALLVAFGDRVEDSGSDDEAAAGDVVDDPTDAPVTDAAPTDAAPTDGGEGGESGDESGEPDPEPSATTADPEVREPVGVLNASSTDGLEVEAQQLFEEGGWEVPATATYDGSLEVTTVFYPEGMEEAAEALQAQFPAVQEIEPTIEGLNASRLVVIVADDFASAVGDSD